jgi:hypothetical protein
MTRWRGDAEEVAFEKTHCTDLDYCAIINQIKETLRRVNDAKSSEGGFEEDGQFPLVRVDGGV